jgi:hypothetical protein
MKFRILPLATAVLVASAPAAFAQGVSGSAPGQQQPKNYQGSPGSSYYAPGQEKKNPDISNPNPGSPGASGYAPRRSTTGATTLIKRQNKTSLPFGKASFHLEAAFL